MTIEFLNPEEAPAPEGSYSNLAILPPGKRILVIAGQIGNLIDGSMVEGLEAQYEQTLKKNILALVTSQGEFQARYCKNHCFFDRRTF